MRFPTYQASNARISTQIAKPQLAQTDLSGLAQGIEGYAREQKAREQKWQEAKNIAETNQAYNNIEQGVNDIVVRASQDKDYKNSQQYLDEINELRGSQANTFTDEVNGLRFQRIADSKSNQAIAKINGVYRDKYIKHQQGEFVRSYDMTKAGYMDGNESSKEIMKGIAKENYDAGFISQTAYNKAMDDVAKWDYEKAEQDVNLDPEAFKASLDSYTNLTETEKLELSKDADALIQKKNDETLINNLQIESKNSNELAFMVNDNSISTDEKVKQVNSAILMGRISNETGIRMKSILKSPKTVNAVTNNKDLSDLVLGLSTINTNKDLDAKDYLEQLNQLRDKAMDLQAQGRLSVDEANILYGQMDQQVTKNREARALSKIADGSSWGYGYNEAFDYFSSNLTETESYGALRTYFNAISGGDYNDDQKKQIAYKIRKEQSRVMLEKAINESR